MQNKEEGNRRQPEHVANENEQEDEEFSGFVKDLHEEMNRHDALQTERTFTALTPIYVSRSGHARLFTARRFGKQYTLKCLKEDYAYSAPYQQALAKEFEIGIQLDHPYICHTQGIEEVEGLGQAIVMEYIDGETLEHAMARGTLTKELAERVASQLAEALDYIHSKQILHRDLKPANIMLTYNGHNTKLIDFSLSDSDDHCVLKMPAGTTSYIAPEVLKDGYKANMKADIYSYGVVLRQMAQASGNKHLMRCAKACTKEDPEQRPATASQALAYKHSYDGNILAQGLLLVTCLLLATAIIIGLHHRQNNHTNTLTPDGNEVSTSINIQEN